MIWHEAWRFRCFGEERGGDRQMITQTLINALNDPNSYNRGNAADSLGGRDAEVVIPVLIPLLDKYKDDFYTIKGVSHALSSEVPPTGWTGAGAVYVG